MELREKCSSMCKWRGEPLSLGRLTWCSWCHGLFVELLLYLMYMIGGTRFSTWDCVELLLTKCLNVIGLSHETRYSAFSHAYIFFSAVFVCCIALAVPDVSLGWVNCSFGMLSSLFVCGKQVSSYYSSIGVLEWSQFQPWSAVIQFGVFFKLKYKFPLIHKYPERFCTPGTRAKTKLKWNFWSEDYN